MRQLLEKYKELILYGIIGASCASLDFMVYILMLHLLGAENVLVANCIGVVCGIVASFTLNRQFNFKVKDKTKQRFLIFLIVGLTGLAISSGALYLLVDVLDYNELYAKLLTIVVVSIIQFILNKTITFKKTQ